MRELLNRPLESNFITVSTALYRVAKLSEARSSNYGGRGQRRGTNKEAAPQASDEQEGREETRYLKILLKVRAVMG